MSENVGIAVIAILFVIYGGLSVFQCAQMIIYRKCTVAQDWILFVPAAIGVLLASVALSHIWQLFVLVNR